MIVKARCIGLGSGRRLLMATGATGAAALLGSFVSAPVANAATRFTGPPIKIGIQVPVNTPVTSNPEFFDGAAAAAAAINKAGGIHGHEVQVVTCNGQFNPAQELACAQSSISDGVVAQVGEVVDTNTSGVDAAFAAADTANLAPEAALKAQFMTPIEFPLALSIVNPAVCATKALQKSLGAPVHLQPVAVNLIAASLVPVLQSTATAQGTTVYAPVTVGATTVDFSSAVARAAGNQPNVLTPGLLPAQTSEFVTAATAGGQKWAYCTYDGALSAKQLSVLAPKGGPAFYFGASWPPPSAASKFPQIATMLRQLKAAGKDVAADTDPLQYQGVMNSWLGMQAFAQVANSIKGTIDHATFLAALKTAKVNLGPLLPTINFAHPIGTGGLTQVFNARTWLLRWDPNKQKVVLVGLASNNAFPQSGLGG
jgi:branched-chain amino acid transport system substrate-binding protein